MLGREQSKQLKSFRTNLPTGNTGNFKRIKEYLPNFERKLFPATIPVDRYNEGIFRHTVARNIFSQESQ